MYQNIIFDFGNVLAEFYPEKLTKPCVADKHNLKTISEVVFDRLYWNKLDDGTITDEEVKEKICCRLPRHLHSEACAVYDCWIENLTPVPGMQSIVYDLKNTGRKLFLISNISIGFAEGYKNVPWIENILSLFDGLIFSGPLGLTKPKKEIFEFALMKYALKAEECLFIDDSPINTEGAEKVGISSYLFDGDARKLRTYLNI